MSKKKIISILGVVAGIVIAVLVVVFVVIPSTGEGKNPKPTETSEPEPVADLRETTQYTESELAYSGYFANGELGSVDPETMVLGMWTAGKYIENAITNPYFVSGYWATKDNYMADSLTAYISPYLSKELNEKFLETASAPTEPAFQEYFNNKLYFPDSSLAISDQCFETWETEYCFSEKPVVTNMSYSGLENGSIQINATVQVDALYQKPDMAQGNLISQQRTYNLTFILEKQNPPTSLDAEIPIMIITSIDSSLDIRGQTDYLVNES